MIGMVTVAVVFCDVVDSAQRATAPCKSPGEQLVVAVAAPLLSEATSAVVELSLMRRSSRFPFWATSYAPALTRWRGEDMVRRCPSRGPRSESRPSRKRSETRQQLCDSNDISHLTKIEGEMLLSLTVKMEYFTWKKLPSCVNGHQSS
ncbi:hypothetical protein TEQG_00399 [Trichophyton equinum CBS 127.97]|uniref:Secreted protein n=1 Tax=Trichophyton equinum (strain ATCC MYA-4606 / CBS 127.97) TaxID=559882 RepID=F2PHH9_TRIEC|nr:hypothetical protein TEQG_00399 [Trichophyton equinum CBS 127.97]